MENQTREYCNNCGNYGHSYANCRHPILSYGIILYNYNESGVPYIVLVERKDSLSYIEFLRGKYKSIYDTEYIELLFSRFSKEELEKIDKYDFDTLWNKLWIHTETINPRIKREYKKSKNDFYKLKQGYKKGETTINIKYLINKVNTIDEKTNEKSADYILKKEIHEKNLLNYFDNTKDDNESKAYVMTNDDFSEKNAQLRNKLGDTTNKIRFIKTIHGIGYKFIATPK